MLLNTDVNLDHQNVEGKTALHRAVYKNQVDIVQCLIEYGADTNIQVRNR